MSTLRSTTGDHVVVCGDRLIGPFDGKNPADQFAAKMRRHGYEVHVQRVWPIGAALLAMRVAKVAP